MDKLLKFSLAIGVIVISLSIAYYFIIFLPKNRTQGESENQEVIENSENSVDAELTKDEINEISKSIVSLECLYDANNDGQWDDKVYGSGAYIHKSFIDDEYQNKEFDFNDGIILTNGHVAQLKSKSKKGYDYNFCTIEFGSHNPKGNFGRVLGMYAYNDLTHFFNKKLDIALLTFKNNINGVCTDRPYFNDDLLKSLTLKYYSFCDPNKIIGSKIYIFGYPSAAFEHETIKDLKDKIPALEKLNSNDDDLILVGRNLIVAEGVISGKDRNNNYYTDAKIDAGNSGGLAVSKIDGEVCVAGMPTWVSQGQYENIGLIQPLNDTIKILFKNTFK